MRHTRSIRDRILANAGRYVMGGYGGGQCLLVLGLLFALGGTAPAAVQPGSTPSLISINNPSFEMPVLTCQPGPGCFAENTFVGWTYAAGDTATFRPSVGSGQEFASLPDGAQVAAIGDNSSGEIYQDLSVRVAANTTYALSFWVGQRTDFVFNTGYTVSLIANGVTLASASGAAPPPGAFVEQTIIYASGSSPAQLGQTIRIDISVPAQAGQADFDLFTMNVTPGNFGVLHTFTGAADGGLPFAGMITDSAGNLYGTAGAGGTGSCSYFGTSGCGTIFELKKHNSSFLFNPLYSFQGGTDGEFSVRPMTLGPNGTYYGATLGGGEGTCSYDGVPECGVVFNAGSSPTPQRTPLLKFIEHGIPYRFTGGSDGATPFTTLFFDSSGNIYGTTYAGGAHGFGTVFELVNLGGGDYRETVLWSFAGGNDGAYPLDGLIADSAGNFYGTTSAGGSTTACSGAGCGTVFKLTPTGGGNYTESPIYRFQGTSDGENPNAGVAIDTAGNLYGNTWQGGNGGGGTVYELSPNGSNWTFNLLYSVPNAGFAVGRVALDSSGNVYEALQDGGAFGDGQVLELMHSGSNWNYIDLYDFTGGTDGKNAIGGVNFDASGNLYGTTTFGAGTGCGGNGCGVVWEIMPTN